MAIWVNPACSGWALEPWDITRMNEAATSDADLLAVPKNAGHRDRWLDALAAHPGGLRSLT